MLYCAWSILGASGSVKTPVRGVPSTSIVMPAISAGVSSQASWATFNKVSPRVPSSTKMREREERFAPRVGGVGKDPDYSGEPVGSHTGRRRQGQLR